MRDLSACHPFGLRGPFPSVPLAAIIAGLPGLLAWYDPSDLSTLFQDAMGTIPVTSAGDPVGLMLDKSQGLAAGVEIADPDTVHMTTPGDWVIDAATGTFERVAGSGFSELWWDVTPGKFYVVAFSVQTTASTARLIRKNAEDTSNQSILSDVTNGSFTARFKVFDTTTDRIVFTGNAWRGTISDISIRELPGHHLTAPFDAARPTYQTGGGLHWLESDGIDDYMTGGPVHGAERTIGLAVQLPGDATEAAIVYGGRSATDLRSYIGLAPSVPELRGAVGEQFQIGGMTVPLGTGHSVVLSYDGSETSIGLDDGPVVTGAQSGSTTPGAEAYLGALNNNGSPLQHFYGRFYGGVDLDRVVTAQERAFLNTWLMRQAGRP